MTLRFFRVSGFLSLMALFLSCARGDKADPGRVGDLTFICNAESLTCVQGRVADTRTLAWTAAGDDGRHGEATLYDIRYISSSELGKRNWTPEQAFGRYFDQTTPFINEPKPSPAGTLERWFLPRLDVSEKYFFALTVEDEVGRFSGLSNIAGPAQPSLLALPLLAADGSTESGLGSAVASAQDLNGDKINDLVAGSPLQGKAYIYFGAGTNDLLETIAVNNVKVRKVKKELLPAITLIGSTAEEFGAAVAGVGKVNSGPKADLAVGAPAADAGAGKAYLFDGDSLAEGEVQDTNANVVILGDMAGDSLGASVVALGDLNRDGFSDFAATAPGAGKVYIFLGGDEGSARGPLPSGQTAGQVAALTLVGETVGDGFGQVLVRGGDLNGDGIPDLVVAAPEAANGATAAAGAVYVFYGGDAGGIKFKTDLQAAGSQKVWNLAGQEADVTIRGTAIGERFGSAVASAGDLRKRPLTETATDLAVGAPGEGRVFIFYAGAVAGKEIFPASATGLVWQDTDRHEVLEGDTADGFGESLVGPGDINLDGYDDLVVGLPGQEEVQIYFWILEEPVTNFRTLLLTSTLGSGFGLGLASAGDLNQDGYADLIIGAPDAGLAYLEF